MVWINSSLSIHLLKDILAAFKCWQLSEAAINIHVDFVWIQVQLLWVNTKVRDYWIIAL